MAFCRVWVVYEMSHRKLADKGKNGMYKLGLAVFVCMFINNIVQSTMLIGDENAKRSTPISTAETQIPRRSIAIILELCKLVLQ